VSVGWSSVEDWIELEVAGQVSRIGSWRTFLGTEVVANPRATGFSCVFFFFGMAKYYFSNRKRSDAERSGGQFRRHESSHRQVEFPNPGKVYMFLNPGKVYMFLKH